LLHVQTANISLKLNSKDDNDDDNDDIWYLESGEKTTAEDVDTERSLAIPLTTQELDYLVNCTRCYSFGGKNFKFRVEKYIKDGTTVIGVKCKKCGRVKTLEKKGTSIL
jgi:hypothetical protein